jgi:hypothetical protein
MESLYHSDIFLPGWFDKPTGLIRLNYGHHARQEAQEERLGRIQLPNFINLDDFRVIEIGVRSGRVSKMLVRGEYDSHFDVCFVIVPGEWFVKTVWLNRWDDTHQNLVKSRYESE